MEGGPGPKGTKGRKPGPATQAIRAVRLLRKLDTGQGFYVWRIAQILGVSPRTVRRDIDALRDAGEAVRVEGGRVFLEKRVDLNPGVVRETWH